MENLTEKELNKICKLQIIRFLNSFNSNLTNKNFNFRKVKKKYAQHLPTEYVLETEIFHDEKLLASIVIPINERDLERVTNQAIRALIKK